MASPPAIDLLQQHVRSLSPLLRQLTGIRCYIAPWLVQVSLDYSRRASHDRTLPLHEIEEGLALLTLLHTLDADAYVALVVEIWPSTRSLSLGESGKYPLGVEISISGAHGVIQLMSYSVQRQEIGRSPTYQQVLQSVRDAQGDPGGWAPPRLPVCLTLGESSFDESVDLAMQIHVLYPTNDREAVFEIKEARWGYPLLTLGTDELEQISALETLGISFYVSSFGSCTVWCLPKHRLPALKTMRRQLAVSAALDQEKAVRGAHSLTVPNSEGNLYNVARWDAFPTPLYWVPALFSAIHGSLSLHNINVDASFEDLRSDGRLQWFVYAAFWKRSKLKRLKLNCSDIEMRDVADIKEMLETTDPLRLAMRGYGEKTPMMIQVSVTRFHLCGPRTAARNDSSMIFSPPEPLAVEVIRVPNGDGEMVQVMLPGHGVAWVYREDIVSEESRDSVDQLPTIPATIELESVNLKSRDATLALLRIVNAGLSRLEVTRTRGIDIDEWLRQVATTCTNLKEVCVNGVHVNLEVIGDIFTIDTFRPSRLEIVDPIVCNGGHVRRFFEDLADPHHPIASHLQSLDIKVTADEAEKFNFLDAFLDVLRCNVRLLELKIRLCLPRLRPIPKSYFNAIRDSHRNDMMAIPLDTSSKLAFLSIVGTSDDESAHAAHRLNSNVISMIFEFSARSHKRNVKVEIVRVSYLGR